MSAPRPLSHWLLLLALVAMWGTSFLANKIAVGALPPLAVVATRLSIAAIVLYGFLALRRRWRFGSRRLWTSFVIMALIGNCLPFLLIAWGQQRIDSGLAGILMAVMPLMTIVLAHWFVPGEPLTRRRLGGFLLGFTGMIVLVGPEAILPPPGGGTLLAELAVLGGALCYAVNAIIARQRPASDAIEAAAGVSIAATLMLAPMALTLDVPLPFRLSIEAAMAVAFLGLIATALATVVYFRIIAVAGPSFLSLINYLIPLWALAAGVIALGERPHPRALIALALVLAGIALAESRRRPAASRLDPRGASGDKRRQSPSEGHTRQ